MTDVRIKIREINISNSHELYVCAYKIEIIFPDGSSILRTVDEDRLRAYVNCPYWNVKCVNFGLAMRANDGSKGLGVHVSGSDITISTHKTRVERGYTHQPYKDKRTFNHTYPSELPKPTEFTSDKTVTVALYVKKHMS